MDNAILAVFKVHIAEKSITFFSMILTRKLSPFSLCLNWLAFLAAILPCCSQKRPAKQEILAGKKSRSRGGDVLSSHKASNEQDTAGPTQKEPAANLGRKSSVAILDVGIPPHSLLLYHWPQGHEAVYSGKMKQITVAPRPLGPFEVDYTFTLRQKAVRVESNKIALSMYIEKAQVRLPSSMKSEKASIARRLSGVKFQVEMDDRGKVLLFRPVDPVPKHLAEPLQKTAGSLSRLGPIFPEKPVGLGARWRQTEIFPGALLDDSSGALVCRLSYLYTLTRVIQHAHGKVAEIEFETDLSVGGRTSSGSIKGKGSGGGSTLFSLATGLMVEHHASIKVVSRLKGYTTTNSTELDIKLDSFNP